MQSNFQFLGLNIETKENNLYARHYVCFGQGSDARGGAERKTSIEEASASNASAVPTSAGSARQR